MPDDQSTRQDPEIPGRAPEHERPIPGHAPDERQGVTEAQRELERQIEPDRQAPPPSDVVEH